MSRIFVIDRDGNSHDVPATPGGKVMETLRELDYGVAAICGGLCSCATCHVYIDHEWLPKIAPLHSDEHEMLKELSTFRPDTSRLSCQIEFTPALDGLKLTIAPEE
jgi:2Fe-2S ferredoxin